MNVSASKYGLLKHCQYFAREGVKLVDEPSYVARRGTHFHEAIAAYIAGATVKTAKTKWFAQRFPHARSYIDELRRDFPVLLVPEVRFVWRDGVVQCLDFGERAPYPEGWFGGTVDLITWSEKTRHVDIADWKTGRYVSEAHWEQLRCLSMMVFTWFREHMGAETFSGTLLHVQEGEVVPRHSQWFDHEEEAGKLKGRLSLIDDAWPIPGAHCDEHYCAARDNCAAYKRRAA